MAPARRATSSHTPRPWPGLRSEEGGNRGRGKVAARFAHAPTPGPANPLVRSREHWPTPRGCHELRGGGRPGRSRASQGGTWAVLVQLIVVMSCCRLLLLPPDLAPSGW
jgi:hypothetical protein